MSLYGSNMGLGGTGVGPDWTQPFGSSAGLGSCHEVSVHGPANIGLQPYFVVGKYDFDRTRNTSTLGTPNNVAAYSKAVVKRVKNRRRSEFDRTFVQSDDCQCIAQWSKLKT